MEKWTKQKIITYSILLILLIARFPVGDFGLALGQFFKWTDFSSEIDALRLFQNWMVYPWEKISFVLVGIVIFVNRSDLKKINIDKGFLVLYAVGGILFCWYYFWPLGWTGILISGYIIDTLSKNEFNLQNDLRPNPLFLIMILVTLFFLSILLRNEALNFATLSTMIQYISPQLHFLLVEEVVFRGLLWMYLEESGWSKPAVIAIQAFLFWIFHVYYIISQPVFFWLIVPIASVFLGAVVWKYRSITPSLITHILFNLL